MSLSAAVLLAVLDFGSISEGFGYCRFGGGIVRVRFKFLGCLVLTALLSVSDSGGISDGYVGSGGGVVCNGFEFIGGLLAAHYWLCQILVALVTATTDLVSLVVGVIDLSLSVVCWRHYWLRRILVASVTAAATADLVAIFSAKDSHYECLSVVSDNVDSTLVALSEVAYLSMTL